MLTYIQPHSGIIHIEHDDKWRGVLYIWGEKLIVGKLENKILLLGKTHNDAFTTQNSIVG